MDNKSKKPPKGNVKFNITLSDEQKLAKENIMKHAFSFVVGKAGSGKTLLAVQVALDMFFKRQYNKIIITRPTVATEDNGFLPGTEKEKLEPWLVPIMSNMRKVYNKPEKIKTMVDSEDIELVSLSHFRGRTFDDAVVIVDEFQNLTKAQLRMALGRLGRNSSPYYTNKSVRARIDKLLAQNATIWSNLGTGTPSDTKTREDGEKKWGEIATVIKSLDEVFFNRICPYGIDS
jgi:predicted ribonuclease YlaK